MNLVKYATLATFMALNALFPSSVAASGDGAIPVKVVKQGKQYILLRDGQPYAVKGAGLEFGDVAVFASHGGNSIRTWRTDNAQSTGQEVLDEAARHNVTVALCIEIGRERHGFDYDDEKAVARQLEYARGEVLKYRNHPALLTWVIGNEPNLLFKNPKVFDAINDISEMIHELDPNHPTTSAMAGIDAGLAGLLEQRAPDLDFISIQMYGEIVNLPRYLEEMEFNQPYMVTEWGAVGHWEVPKTSWGAPVEHDSSKKARNYLDSYRIAIASNPDQVLGSYVFLWGQKQERTPTWYGMFLDDGTATETVDVMQFIWTGSWPENRSPNVAEMLLNSQNAYQDVSLESGKAYAASIVASDPEGDTLRYRWEVMRESDATQTGGDREDVPKKLIGLVDAVTPGKAVLTAPKKPGAYRLFVYVYDDNGHAGHANVPFLVRN